MNPKGWNELVDQVRKQIEDVNNSLVNREEKLPSAALSDAKRNIEHLIASQGNPREAFYQLPIVLRSMINHNVVGALILDRNGRIALLNGDMKDFWPFDQHTNSLRADCFYRPDEPLPITRNDLPWHGGPNREVVATNLQLLCRDAGKSDLQVDVTVMPMTNAGQPTGEVMVLFRDLSESLKADQYVKNLCRLLETQVSSMEAAQRELKLLVDKLANEHVQVESVLLPPASPPQPAPAQPSSVLTRPPLEKRVLVVDDIPVNQKVLIMHLNKLGVSADAANNGLEAVNACKNKRYSLVLMDLDMPILNGLEATVDIRKFETALGLHTPIIAMTSFDRPGDRERCLQAGMDDFLGKGESKAQLHEIVNRFVFGALAGDNVTGLPAYKEEMKSVRQGLDLDFAWIKDALGNESLAVVSQFIFTSSSLMERLKLVIEEKNSLQVTHVAYSLKGPCSNLGLTLMAKLCAEVADDAFLGGWKQAEEKFQVLNRMFAAVQEQAGNLSESRSEKTLRK
jgi:CheY-like chemotaxis protein